jgi:hypothetical protein
MTSRPRIEPGVDSPERDALADEMRRALDEEVRYDDDDWTRLADAALRWFAELAPDELDVVVDELRRLGYVVTEPRGLDDE